MTREEIVRLCDDWDKLDPSELADSILAALSPSLVTDEAVEKVVLALEAFNNKYFDFARAPDLKSAVDQARARYEELKDQGKGFDKCVRIASTELVRRVLEQFAASAPVGSGEPVSWERLNPLDGWMPVRSEDIEHYKRMGQDIRPLYTHPPASAPVAQQGEWVRLTRANLSTLEETRNRLKAYEKSHCEIDTAIDECRAMLAASSPPVDAVKVSLDQFERTASRLVSEDYAAGYREACQHIIRARSEP